jgi:hypothetical protein
MFFETPTAQAIAAIVRSPPTRGSRAEAIREHAGTNGRGG